MARWSRTLLALAAAALLAAPSAFAQGGGASSTGSISGEVKDEQGGVLPGVTVTATSPAAIGAQTAVTNEAGIYRFPAVPPGDIRAHLRTGRLRPGHARRHPHHPRLQRPGQRVAARRHAAGNGHGQRRVAGHRHHRDPHPDQLRLAAAGLAAQRPRHVVAAGDDPVGDAEPRRRRRRHDGHADHLLRLRLLGPEPSAHRGHQHHRRHLGGRLLSRLRLLRRGVHRRGRQLGRDAEPRRADAVRRQERQQPARRQPLLRLREREHPEQEPRRRSDRAQHRDPAGRQPAGQLQEPQRRRRRPDHQATRSGAASTT